MKKHQDDEKHSLRLKLGSAEGEARGWLAVAGLTVIGILIVVLAP